MTLELIIMSILLGAGLAMDAFSVSLADGLGEPDMRKGRMLQIAGTFAGFQFAMPLIGWILVRTAVDKFSVLEKFIPWIALLLLLYIGGEMLHEGVKDMKARSTADSDSEPVRSKRLTPSDIVLQGIATSIDALSVGFTIERYGFYEALASTIIIGIVTLVICLAGLMLGRQIGTRLSGKASVFGGVVLILIGIEIFFRGI